MCGIVCVSCLSPAYPARCHPLGQLILLSVSRQIGEGGYAFVYLAKELPTAGRPIASAEAVAIKKVISTLYAHVVDRELLYAPIFAVKSEKDINRSVYLCGAGKGLCKDRKMPAWDARLCHLQLTTLSYAHHQFPALQIIAASGDKLADAKREIEVLKSLSHPNCLPLLEHAIDNGNSTGSLAYNVLLVFPAYQVINRCSIVSIRQHNVDIYHRTVVRFKRRCVQ